MELHKALLGQLAACSVRIPNIWTTHFIHSRAKARHCTRRFNMIQESTSAIQRAAFSSLHVRMKNGWHFQGGRTPLIFQQNNFGTNPVAPSAFGAYLFEDDVHVHPEKTCPGILQSGRKFGAIISEQTSGR